MGNEFDIFFRVFDSLGTFGLLALNVFAFYRGWVIPITIQTKIDAMQELNLKEIMTLHNELRSMQQKRIESLEALVKEREARVEQGVQMLSTYIETQDKLSRLADHMKEGSR